jgi:hypothetical protein
MPVDFNQELDELLRRLAAKEVAGQELSDEEIKAMLADYGPSTPLPEDAVQRIWSKVKAIAAREGRAHELEGVHCRPALSLGRERAAAAGPTSAVRDGDEHFHVLGELMMEGVVYHFSSERARVFLSPAPTDKWKFFLLDRRVYPLKPTPHGLSEIEGLSADRMTAVFEEFKQGLGLPVYGLK